MKIFHLDRQRELVPTHVIHLKLASFCNLYLTTTQLPSVSTTLLSSYKSAVIPSVRPLRSTRGTPSPPPTPVPMPQLLTRPPKGRKAYLWPVAWWAPTAVCSGIRPCERGGAFQQQRLLWQATHCLLFTRQLFKALSTPRTAWRERIQGRTSVYCFCWRWMCYDSFCTCRHHLYLHHVFLSIVCSYIYLSTHVSIQLFIQPSLCVCMCIL